MKKLISSWPGRLVSLFVPVVLMVSFLLPAGALAKKEMSLGGGGTGDSEGDPLDTNDAGGGGGGGSDIHNDTGSPDTGNLWGLLSDKYQVLLVPEVLGGALIFKIVIIDQSDIGLTYEDLEGYHAP